MDLSYAQQLPMTRVETSDLKRKMKTGLRYTRGGLDRVIYDASRSWAGKSWFTYPFGLTYHIAWWNLR